MGSTHDYTQGWRYRAPSEPPKLQRKSLAWLCLGLSSHRGTNSPHFIFSKRNPGAAVIIIPILQMVSEARRSEIQLSKEESKTNASTCLQKPHCVLSPQPMPACGPRSAFPPGPGERSPPQQALRAGAHWYVCRQCLVVKVNQE